MLPVRNPASPTDATDRCSGVESARTQSPEKSGRDWADAADGSAISAANVSRVQWIMSFRAGWRIVDKLLLRTVTDIIGYVPTLPQRALDLRDRTGTLVATTFARQPDGAVGAERDTLALLLTDPTDVET